MSALALPSIRALRLALLTARHVPGTLLAATLSFAAVAALTVRTRLLTYSNPQFAQPFDHQKYIYMARHNPLDFHIWPFCWRVVTPLLAKALPFALETNFFLITFISVWLSSLLVYLICRHYRFSRLYAFTGMAVFLTAGAATKVLIQDFWLSDPLALLLTTLAFYLALRRNPVAFAIVLAIGAATRETVLLAAVLYYTLNAGRVIDLRALRTAVLAALPALATFVGLRLAIPVKNSDPAYLRSLHHPHWTITAFNGGTTHELAVELIHNLASLQYIAQLGKTILISVGVLLLLASAIGAWRNPVLLLRYLPFLLLTSSELFLGGATRYLAPFIPPLTILAVYGIRYLASRTAPVPAILVVALPVTLLLTNLISMTSSTPVFWLQVAIVGLLAIAVLAKNVPRYRGVTIRRT